MMGTCTICGRGLVLEVLQNHSGWYLGYVCNTCGPQTRETGYFATYEEAKCACGYGTFEEVDDGED